MKELGEGPRWKIDAKVIAKDRRKMRLKETEENEESAAYLLKTKDVVAEQETRLGKHDFYIQSVAKGVISVKDPVA